MKKLVFTTLLASILAFSTNAKEIILEDMGKVKVNLTVSIPFSNFDGCNGRFYNIGAEVVNGEVFWRESIGQTVKACQVYRAPAPTVPTNFEISFEADTKDGLRIEMPRNAELVKYSLESL